MLRPLAPGSDLMGLGWGPGHHDLLRAPQIILMCSWSETTAVKSFKIPTVYLILFPFSMGCLDCHPRVKTTSELHELSSFIFRGLEEWWEPANWYLDTLTHFINRCTSHFNESELKTLKISMYRPPKELWLIEVYEVQF